MRPNLAQLAAIAVAMSAGVLDPRAVQSPAQPKQPTRRAEKSAAALSKAEAKRQRKQAKRLADQRGQR